jgi:phospholipid transport system substrate-binding protein
MSRWMLSRRMLLGLSMLAGALSAPTLAPAGPPTDQVKVSTDHVLKLLQDAELKKPARAEERRKQIRAVANELFDWGETGKRALARHWQERTPAQREEFSKLFADLIERSYVSKIEAYSGEKILYLGDSPDGDQATVKTKLVTKSNAEIPLDYRLHRVGDKWRAYDVLIENVSLVGNYRSQFNRIIQQNGYDELVKKLKTKQEELQFEDKK